jgi:hypothetical protein
MRLVAVSGALCRVLAGALCAPGAATVRVCTASAIWNQRRFGQRSRESLGFAELEHDHQFRGSCEADQDLTSSKSAVRARHRPLGKFL